MATWKKVVVSGSSAELAALKVDNLTSGSVVIGGGSVQNLSTTAINGTGNILATTGASGVSISGSFSGSFQGEFSGVSSNAVSASYAFTASSATNAFQAVSSSYAFTASSAINSTNAISASLAVSASTFAVTDTTSGTGPYYLTFVDGTSGFRTPRVDSAVLTFNATTNVLTVTASNAILATTASWANNAGQVNNSLTFGNGLTGSPFNGSTAITAAVGAGALITVDADSVMVTTSSLTTNQIPKLGSNALVGSNISDTGTQVQIGASATSGLSVAAGGVNVTGNSVFNNNVVVSGDLTVAGTASFQNSQNLLVADQFILLASGSSTLVDGGIIVANGGLSGSALYLEVASSGNYGRWAVASELNASATAATADEYMVSAKINQASNPVAAPTWGSTTNGSGNIWVTNAGDIFIYA